MPSTSQRRLFLKQSLSLCLLWGWGAANSEVTTIGVSAPQRVLFVGNSYFYYNNSLHNHVRRLVAADQPALAHKLQYKSATIGGATLGHHNIDWLTRPGQIGVKDPFEWVILAGNSGDAFSEKGRAAFRQTVIEFNQIIRQRGGKTALYMTPAYVKPHKNLAPDNLQKIQEMYVSVAADINAQVIPVGLVFAEAYRRHPELRLHDAEDGSHPSLAGTYLAACTVFGQLYRQSPVGNSYNVFGQLDPATTRKLQQVAWDVVTGFGG